MHNQINSLIVACSTPAGKGALALIRLSGDSLYSVIDTIVKLPGNKRLTDQASHTIHFGTVVDKHEQPIDQVLFLVMRAPKTFTGEDVLEITCHNNPFIINAIIKQALRIGARLAQPGEFTQRAFENKKIDLVQAEAINELLSAQTEAALKKSLAQLQGSLSSWIVSIEQKLIKAYAWSEASFEFLEDDGDFGAEIKQQLNDVLNTVRQVKKTFDVQKQIREGFRIALVGSVNAGKSSLFNRLLGQQRAIVTPIAGTTRDTIEAGLYRNGNYWTLIDTAGLRQTDDIIEQAGIERSWEEAHKADCVILVIDRSRAMTPEEQGFYQQLHARYSHKIIPILSKADLPAQANVSALAFKSNDYLALSSTVNNNCDTLEQTIQSQIDNLLKRSDAPFLINQRHYALLVALEQQLEHIITMLNSDIQYELVSHHLRSALEDLSQLTGKTISEAAMDMVFKEFCVGK